VVDVARSYDEIMQPLRDGDAAEVQQLAAAATVHFEAAYERGFGIGERIAARREQLHLSQQQVAELAGIPQPEVSRIERGKANPTQATLEKIAAALDTQLTLAPNPGPMSPAK
jgi:ribosome-binding protein aMBF1 (putative translation factor)